MNEKAIEVLNYLLGKGDYKDCPDVAKAFTLAIRALQQQERLVGLLTQAYNTLGYGTDILQKNIKQLLAEMKEEK